MGLIQDKVAIITGGARGIGGATARLFVAEGAKVVITDILEEAGQALAAELGAAATFLQHDVTDEARWHAVIAETKRLHGRIDILVNNAGVLCPPGAGSIEECSLAQFERIQQINVSGTYLGIRSVAPEIEAAGGGSIVVTASVQGWAGSNGQTAYVTSKWALRGLMKCAAIEYGHRGVRVNSVNPGVINTDMLNPQKAPASTFDKAMKFAVPQGRVGEPEEIAKASLFLVSDLASYVNGEELAIDGGMIAGKILPLSGGPRRDLASPWGVRP